MDFIISQINGNDVSKSSYEEALSLLDTAGPTVVVHLSRRSNRPISCEKWTQTEIPEECQEISLHFCKCCPKLGINFSEDKNQLIVSQIHSLEAIDGPLEVGDQVLRVNGTDVLNEEHFHQLVQKCCSVLIRKSRQKTLDRDLALLDREMQSIRLECETMVNNRRLKNHIYANVTDHIKDNVFGSEDSSSAYNTGDSSRSTPLTLEVSTASSGVQGSVQTMDNKSTQMSDNFYEKYFCHSMAEKKSILRQQKVSRDQLPSSSAECLSLEWKVKRRSDGSRYITRGTVRNKLLKERALKIMEERCMTTDDDAMSELKFGKYWNKEDRKRHLERSKNRKKRSQSLPMAVKMAALKEQSEEAEKECQKRSSNSSKNVTNVVTIV